uniref:Lipoprotein n=1 Tax=Rhizophora mucronata TaxID=61149 RepID=A0A2P2QAP5_RHIMU
MKMINFKVLSIGLFSLLACRFIKFNIFAKKDLFELNITLYTLE